MNEIEIIDFLERIKDSMPTAGMFLSLYNFPEYYKGCYDSVGGLHTLFIKKNETDEDYLAQLKGTDDSFTLNVKDCVNGTYFKLGGQYYPIGMQYQPECVRYIQAYPPQDMKITVKEGILYSPIKGVATINTVLSVGTIYLEEEKQ